MAAAASSNNSFSFGVILKALPLMIIGAFLASYALEVFLIPNGVIDGGIIGISIICGEIFGKNVYYPMVFFLNLPFVYLAYKKISKILLVQMTMAIILFIFFGVLIHRYHDTYFQPFHGDALEIVVFGGLLLGIGVGLIIRSGGCLDGTEILGLILNKSHSLSVGNVVMGVNILVFSFAGLVRQDWHVSTLSFITFFIVMKIMDMVIVGFDEMKSVMIFSTKAQEIKEIIMHELNLGLTVLHGKGGFSSENREVIFLIAERLQLSSIKEVVHSKDPYAILAIHNLHEVESLGSMKHVTRKTKK